MNNDNIGLRLKDLRKKRGLRQQHIADRFDVSRGTVSNWELGRRIPSIHMLAKLAEFYGVGLDYFGQEFKKNDVLDLLARAGKLFESDVLSSEDKDSLYQDIMRLYLKSKG